MTPKELIRSVRVGDVVMEGAHLRLITKVTINGNWLRYECRNLAFEGRRETCSTSADAVVEGQIFRVGGSLPAQRVR